MATIVVGTDGSKGSEAALSEAVDLAKRLDAKLVVVAAAAPVSDLLGGSVYQARVSEHMNRAREAVGTRGLGALAGSLLGSVLSELVRRSSRPVVVAREPG